MSNEYEIRGRTLAHAYWAEMEKIAGAGSTFFEGLGGFLRSKASRMAGEGVEQTAQRFGRDAAGKTIAGTRIFKATAESPSIGQKARAVGATTLDWAGRHPRTATAITGGGLLAAGAGVGRATS